MNFYGKMFGAFYGGFWGRLRAAAGTFLPAPLGNVIFGRDRQDATQTSPSAPLQDGLDRGSADLDAPGIIYARGKKRNSPFSI